MFSPLKISPLLAVVLLGGCVALPGGPSVMALPGTGKNFDQFRQDDALCRQYAYEQVGGQTANQAATDAAVNSAVVGTLIGAALGAAIDGSRGAGAGAATGLFIGGTSGAGAAQHPPMERSGATTTPTSSACMRTAKKFRSRAATSTSSARPFPIPSAPPCPRI